MRIFQFLNIHDHFDLNFWLRSFLIFFPSSFLHLRLRSLVVILFTETGLDAFQSFYLRHKITLMHLRCIFTSPSQVDQSDFFSWKGCLCESGSKYSFLVEKWTLLSEFILSFLLGWIKNTFVHFQIIIVKLIDPLLKTVKGRLLIKSRGFTGYVNSDH